jgi:hypothetical protein
MPRRPAVIDHPQRARIERLIRAGERSVQSIAAEFGLPDQGLRLYARKLRGVKVRAAAPAPSLDPVETFRAAFDQEPTDYQVEYLFDVRPSLILKSRQSGLTQAASALAIWTARSRPGADAVIVSPSMQQSKEVTTRARIGLYQMGEPLVQDSTSLLRLGNGSRIISLPGSQRAVRGYAPALVVADEASWIEDATYAALRPLLAASRGRLVAQSTPGRRLGWFFDLCEADLGDDWLRLEIPAVSVPFISPDFLERERRELSPETYAAEYDCAFAELGDVGALAALFTNEMIDSMFVQEPEGATAP